MYCGFPAEAMHFLFRCILLLLIIYRSPFKGRQNWMQVLLLQRSFSCMILSQSRACTDCMAVEVVTRRTPHDSLSEQRSFFSFLFFSIGCKSCHCIDTVGNNNSCNVTSCKVLVKHHSLYNRRYLSRATVLNDNVKMVTMTITNLKSFHQPNDFHISLCVRQR